MLPQLPLPKGMRWRFAPALLIVAAALAYYGSYWHYWFNPHDEGGTVCMVAQRLMAGSALGWMWILATTSGGFIPSSGSFISRE